MHTKNAAFLRSKVQQGFIGPLERVRVMDLQPVDADGDKPLSPGAREHGLGAIVFPFV